MAQVAPASSVEPSALAVTTPTAVRRWTALTLCAALEVYFVAFFNVSVWQPTVDLAWALASICFAAAFWRSDVPSVERLAHPWWFYALYAAILIPFAGNWRWTM